MCDLQFSSEIILQNLFIMENMSSKNQVVPHLLYAICFILVALHLGSALMLS